MDCKPDCVGSHLIRYRPASLGYSGSDVGLRPSGPASQTNSNVSSDTLRCPFDGCGAIFTGGYRKGNLGRHRRLKHDGQGVQYPCEGKKCKKSFCRTDARLKHYRTDHPELVGGPVISRNSSSRRSAPTDVATAQSLPDASGCTCPTGQLWSWAHDDRGNEYKAPECLVLESCLNCACTCHRDLSGIVEDGDVSIVEDTIDGAAVWDVQLSEHQVRQLQRY